MLNNTSYQKIYFLYKPVRRNLFRQKIKPPKAYPKI